MTFSISPERIIQMLFDNKKEEKEQIATYLDAIASDAKLLSDIWQDIWDKSRNRAFSLQIDADNLDKPLRQRIKQFHESDWTLTPNGKIISRLMNFYRHLSSVIGGKVNSDFHNLFSFHLGFLLENREITKQTFDKVVPLINGDLFLDAENSRVKIQEFSQLVEALNREAAALEVLAKTYRASK